MFKLNIYLRFALIGLFLGGGIVLAFLFGFWYSFPLLLVGLVLVVGYLLFGTVQSAAEFMQANDFDRCEQRLNLTLSPRLLYVSNRAYYYMIKGSIALFKKETDEGEMWLKKAQSVKVPTDNEKAMIELQLANINATKNKWKQAQLHFRNARQLKVDEPMIKEQLRQFEKALQNRGQMKAATRSGVGGAAMMRQGKSKRRRPRMK